MQVTVSSAEISALESLIRARDLLNLDIAQRVLDITSRLEAGSPVEVNRADEPMSRTELYSQGFQHFDA